MYFWPVYLIGESRWRWDWMYHPIIQPILSKTPEKWVGIYNTGAKTNSLLWAACSTSDIDDEENNSLLPYLVAMTALATA